MTAGWIFIVAGSDGLAAEGYPWKTTPPQVWQIGFSG